MKFCMNVYLDNLYYSIEYQGQRSGSHGFLSDSCMHDTAWMSFPRWRHCITAHRSDWGHPWSVLILALIKAWQFCYCFCYYCTHVCEQIAGYIGNLVKSIDESIKLGVVQTAYANGSSTKYITDVLVRFAHLIINMRASVTRHNKHRLWWNVLVTCLRSTVCCAWDTYVINRREMCFNCDTGSEWDVGGYYTGVTVVRDRKTK